MSSVDPAPPNRATPESTEAPPPADRRATASDRRAKPDRRQKQVPVAVERRSGVDRRTQPDRRAPDPGKTAGGYDLDAETLEFIHAINRFKAESGRPFPTWSEVLGILRGLGYERRTR